MTNIRKIQRDAADAWLRNCLRYSPASKAITTMNKSTKPTDPSGFYRHLELHWIISWENLLIFFFRINIANIVHLLSSYDAPVPAPSVPNEPMLVKKLPLSELKRTVLRTMQADFKKIVELSRLFHMDVQELSSLDSRYKEMFRNLHENKMRKECREIRCSSIVSSNSCKGSLFVTIDVSGPKEKRNISNLTKNTHISISSCHIMKSMRK